MPKGFEILVDSNMLNSPELLEYFNEYKGNKIVLPDYIAFEAYKDENIEHIAASMETISQFPEQVLVLHGTRVITKLKDHAEILKWRFVNQDHTKEIKNFFRGLSQARRGNQAVKEYLLEQAKAANELIGGMLNAGEELHESFKEIEEKLFDKSEVKKMRQQSQYTQAMMKKIYYMAEKIANEVYLVHPDHKRPPKSGVHQDCFLFRYGVAVTLLTIKWIGRGNAQDVKAEKMRNDLIDATLVAYSTFYDGLLTNDKDMMWLQAMTDRYLEVIS